MEKTKALTENADFRRTYYKGKSVVTPFVVIYYRKNNQNYNRLGITVTKKIGNAVKRNRARRIIKEAYRELEKSLKTGYDFVLVARGKTPFIKMADVKAALNRCFEDRNIKDSVL